MSKKIKMWNAAWKRGLHNRWYDHSPEGWLYELVPFEGQWTVCRNGERVKQPSSLDNARFGARMDWEARNGIVSYPRVLGGGKKPERVKDGT